MTKTTRATEPLPALMDARAIATELGIPIDAAYRLMEKLEKVRFDGLRKIYVKRAAVMALIERSTVGP